jgi:hypothetical protein
MPTGLWVEPTDANGIPARIDVFVSATQTTNNSRTYTCQLYLPGNANPENCLLLWDGGMQATVGGTAYESGSYAVPALETEKSLSFKSGRQTVTYKLTVYQGSSSVPAVFIEIDESEGHNTIAQMDGDQDHNVTCTGTINIAGQWYVLDKMKGRGNATWKESKDKKPYNITLGSKINFPGIDSAKTKKW